MEQETNYKERMLDELIDLTAKTERLNMYLQSLNNKPVNDAEKEKIDLMHKQIDIMVNYNACLSRRILLEMK